jgi:hypothetical protein
MVGMVSQFGRGKYVDQIVGRGIQSGGSIGGNKKAGTVNYGVSWSRGNMGNFLVRAPQRTPSVLFMLLNTTRHPVQGTNYQVARSRTLG